MRAPLLILTVGNESRGDDAIGPLLLRRMAGWFVSCGITEQVELIEEFQLQIENTLDLERRKLVLFIDAGRQQASTPFSFYEAMARRPSGYTSHAVAPETLLGLYAMVQNERAPPLFVLSIAGLTFELGEPLSKQAKAHLDCAFRFACTLFAQPEPDAWGRLAQALAPTEISASTMTGM